MARVFVTGASGFIGGALAARLLERGDEVVGLARSDEAAAVVASRGAEVARGDLLDEDSLVAGMEGRARVSRRRDEHPLPLGRGHAAPRQRGGAEAAVRAAARAGVPRMVFTSSAASVGEPPGTVGREDTTHRGWYLSVYDRSKHLGERAAFRAAQRLGVELVAVNPSSVQGPGRSSGTGVFLIAYLNGRLRVFVDTYVSVVDIADTVEAHLLAAERGRSGQRYVLNGATIPSGEALRIVSELSGISEPVRMVPPVVARAAATLAEGVAWARGRTSSLCRARVRTLLHGHPTTARWRPASWDSPTRRSPRRSAGRSSGRWPRGSSPAGALVSSDAPLARVAASGRSRRPA